MSVTFLITGLGRGGAETQLVRISSELRRRGHDVEVVTLAELQSAALVKTLEDADVPLSVLGVSGSKDILKTAKFVKHLRKRKPQTLCSFLFHANIFAVTAGPLARVPKVVISIRSEYFGDDGDKRLKIGKVAFKAADVVTINSAIVRDKMIARDVIAAHKMTVVPNAIDVDRFRVDDAVRDETRNALGIDEATFTFVAVGRVNVLKDYPTMIRAIGKTDAQLLICGKTDDQEESLLALAEKHQAKVRFLGLREDIPELLSACDALVLSSTTEGMPNSVLEGHAAGLPVVATDVGGVPEIVTAESGFVCPASDPDALAEAMNALIALPKKERLNMGLAGREHVEQHFGLAAIADRWERVLFG